MQRSSLVLYYIYIYIYIVFFVVVVAMFDDSMGCSCDAPLWLH